MYGSERIFVMKTIHEIVNSRSLFCNVKAFLVNLCDHLLIVRKKKCSSSIRYEYICINVLLPRTTVYLVRKWWIYLRRKFIHVLNLLNSFKFKFVLIIFFSSWVSSGQFAAYSNSKREIFHRLRRINLRLVRVNIWVKEIII